MGPCSMLDFAWSRVMCLCTLVAVGSALPATSGQGEAKALSTVENVNPSDLVRNANPSNLQAAGRVAPSLSDNVRHETLKQMRDAKVSAATAKQEAFAAKQVAAQALAAKQAADNMKHSAN